MLRSLSTDARQRLFLSLAAAVGIVFILIATSKYGAGVSSDAARNLSTADNLLAGKGFVDMVGAPFVLWPPLYPLLLAALAFLTHLSTFVVAWYLNVALYGANIWLSGWLLYRIFRHAATYSMIGTMVILLSRSMLRIHANVASEPLFLTLALLSLLAASDYLRNGSQLALWSMCVAAGLAALQRYLGLTLIGVAAIVILRRETLRGVLRGAPPWLISLAPMLAWVLFHNYPMSGTLFGPRQVGAMLPMENIGLSLTKILWWFVPRWGFLDWLVLRPWLPILLLVAALLILNRRTDWWAWLKALSSPQVWPSLLFAMTYFVLLAFTVVTADHLDLTSDRYYIVLLPMALALIFITFDTLVLSHLPAGRRNVTVVLAGLLLAWSLYPFYALQSYLRQALVQGEPTNYNIANSASFREMSVVKAAETILRDHPQALVYSNYVNIVWFILGHPVESLPFENESLPRSARLSELARNYPAWPDTPGYIIWFTPNQYHHIVAPDELATIANLTPLFEDETGRIYFVDARRP
jgi:hypothetical protein